jgi:hypothetical protein
MTANDLIIIAMPIVAGLLAILATTLSKWISPSRQKDQSKEIV